MLRCESPIPPFIDSSSWLFEDGWSYRSAPWPDILEDKNLVAPDPWRRFLCVLERAKAGDFRSLDLLPMLLHTTEDYRLKQAIFLLLGATTAPPVLAEVDRYLLDEEGCWRDLAVDAAEWSGDLRFVGPLLVARRRAFGECARGFVDDALCRLLSDEAVWADRECLDRRPDHAIRDRAEELVEKYGPVAFWRGNPLDLHRIANDAGDVLMWPAEDLAEAGASLSSLLFRLETLTGIPAPPIRELGLTADTPLVSEIQAMLAACHQVADARDLCPGRRAFFGFTLP